MTDKNDFAETFSALKNILKPYEKKLILVHDTDSNYYLDTHHFIRPKYPLFFAAVRSSKAYVSFHLMPVYANAALLEGMSPELKRHMQGKSCFNFKKPDAKLFKELAAITKKGFALFNDKKFREKIFR